MKYVGKCIWLGITGNARCCQVQFFKTILTDDAIVRPFVWLTGCSTLYLNFLRIVEREESLDDMKPTIFFNLLIQKDEISPSSEGISHEGDNIGIDCPHNPWISNRRLMFFSEVGSASQEGFILWWLWELIKFSDSPEKDDDGSFILYLVYPLDYCLMIVGVLDDIVIVSAEVVFSEGWRNGVLIVYAVSLL